MEPLIHPKFYHDTTNFDLEKSKIFRSNWVYVTNISELKSHNSFVVRNVGGESIIVQNFGGLLKAFRNTCTHRFNKIHAQAKGVGPLLCNYHGWRFNEEGLPTSIPKRPRFDGLTEEKLCRLKLKPWRVELCGDFVFVTEDLNAPSLKNYLGTAYTNVENLSKACDTIIDENIMEISANWKILIENTLESYHVGFIHPETFGRLGVGDGKFRFDGDHSAWDTGLGKGVMGRLSSIDPRMDHRFLPIDGYHHQFVFPNLTIASTCGTSVSVQIFEPVTTSLTRFTSTVFSGKTIHETKIPQPNIVLNLLESVKRFNRAVFSEDKIVCENVHSASKDFSGEGILSDEEERVHKFQTAYARHLNL